MKIIKIKKIMEINLVKTSNSNNSLNQNQKKTRKEYSQTLKINLSKKKLHKILRILVAQLLKVLVMLDILFMISQKILVTKLNKKDQKFRIVLLLILLQIKQKKAFQKPEM